MPSGGDRLSSVVHLLLAATGLAFVVLFLIVAVQRLSYPYELEWMEGGVVDHVHRVLTGRPLYSAPSLEHVPFIYTPLYYYAAALLSRLTGEGFLAPRLLSLGSACGSFALVGLLVRRETGSAALGVVSAGLLAATYGASGFWFDIARVDSLSLCLTLAGAYVLRSGDRAGLLALAGVLLGLGFLAKQSGLVVAVPLVVAAFVGTRGLVRWAAPLSLAAVVGGSTLLFNGASDGWYAYYVFLLPLQHGCALRTLATFWTHDLAAVLGPALAGTGLLFHPRVRSWGRRDLLFLGALLAGLVGASWLARLHPGGWDNVLMPAHAALAVGGGLALHTFGVRLRRRPLAAVVPLVLGAVQFGLLVYDPAAQLPSDADRRAGDRLVARLARLEGGVLVLSHGHLASLAGKGRAAQGMAIQDVLRGAPDSPARRALLANVHRRLGSREIEAVVVDAEYERFFPPDFVAEVRARFAPGESVFVDPDVFWPVTGMPTRPEIILRRRRGRRGRNR